MSLEKDNIFVQKINTTLDKYFGDINLKNVEEDQLIKYCKKYLITKNNYSIDKIKEILFYTNSEIRKRGSCKVLNYKQFEYSESTLDNIFSKSELNDCVDQLENAQDQAMVYCLFFGIYGKKAEEIINLKISQVDLKNKKIYLQNRIIEMDDLFVDIMSSALEQEIYCPIYIQGEKRYSEFKFNMNSEYVFKVKGNKKNNNGLGTFSYEGFKTRIKKIRDISEKNFTPETLVKSGIIYNLIKEFSVEGNYKKITKWVEDNNIRANSYKLTLLYKEFIMKKDF